MKNSIGNSETTSGYTMFGPEDTICKTVRTTPTSNGKPLRQRTCSVKYSSNSKRTLILYRCERLGFDLRRQTTVIVTYKTQTQ